jgi:hypothetical protein
VDQRKNNMTMPSKRKVTIENLGEFRWMYSGDLMVEPVNKPGNILCIVDKYRYYSWTPRLVCDAIKNAIKNGWDIQGKFVGST